MDESSRDLLFEREVAESTLDEMLVQVKSGRGRYLFAAAPAGLGKTALLDRVLRRSREEGFRVGHAVANPMERAIPFGLLDQVINMLGGTDAVSDVANVDLTEPNSSRLYRTMRWIERASSEQPLLLVLDDLHWSDEDSLQMVGYLCRRVAPLRIGVVGALRPEPDPAYRLIASLVDSPDVPPITLKPLSKSASSALSSEILGRELTDAEAETVWRHTAGTPLLVKSVAEAMRQGSSLNLFETRENTTPHFNLDRFAGVSSSALAYAKAASIFGVRFRHSLAAQLARVDEDGAVMAHEQLVRAGLVEDLGGGWSRFVHPLFAESLLNSLTLSSLEELHARAFRLLVNAGLPDAEAAEHAYAGALVGDPLAVEVATQAGQSAAAQGAFEAAATHLSHAVELAADRASVALRLAYAGILVALVRTDEARALCDGILTERPLVPSVRTAVLRLLAQAAFVTNQPSAAERLFEEAAAIDDPLVEGQVRLYGALTCLATSKMGWVEEEARRAMELLPRSSREYTTCELVHAYTRIMGGDASGVATIESATASFLAGGFVVDPASRWAVAFLLHGGSKLLEHYDDSQQIFTVEYARALQTGSPLSLATMAISHADNLHRRGRPREAMDLVRSAISVGHYEMSPWQDIALAALSFELDLRDAAEEHLSNLRDFVLATPRGYSASPALWSLHLTARRLLDEGHPHEASAVMRDLQALALEAGIVNPLFVPWAPAGIQAHIHAGNYDLAESLVGQLQTTADDLALRWPRAVATLGRAQLAGVGGDHELATQLFELAVKEHRSSEAPIYCAEALVTYGTYLRRTRRVTEARTALRDAVTLAESSGSARVARVALAELAAAGGRRPRSRPSSVELTAREAEIAKLAADGRSNAEIGAILFLSVKTVEHHLGHVYQKLGVTSRRSLVGRSF